jgi:hypothetical protein
MANDEKKKKLVAFFILIILLIAIVGAVFYGTPSEEEKKEPDEEILATVYENFPVTTGDMDNNEPSLAINPRDHLNIVAGSNDYNTPDSDAWPGYYTTFDGGETWSQNLIPGYPGDSETSQLSGFRGGGDPVIVAANDGIFYYAGIAFKRTVNPFNPLGFGINLGLANCVFVARSDDSGNTFDPVIVWAASQSLVRFNDKEWVATDPNDSNYVYLVWSIFTGLMTSRLLFSRSTDGGRTWSYPPTTISETTDGEINIQGSAIVVDNNAAVHVTWIDFGANQVRYAVSTNRGGSFSAPVNVAPIDPIPRELPNGDYRTPTMSMLAVDNSDTNTSGSLYVTWADISLGDSDVFLAYSNDNGNSWDGPVRVNNDNESNGIDQFFPAVAVSEEGLVHVTFYDRRNDVNNTWLEYWWAISFDYGETFPVNLRMSDTTFNGDYSRDPGRTDFIGDYTGVVANNETVGAVWCDTREGSDTDGDTEIYYAGIPYLEVLENLNKIDDDADTNVEIDDDFDIDVYV